MARVLIWLVGMLLAVPGSAQFFPPVKEKTSITGIGIYKEIGYRNSYLLTLDLAREYRLRTWFSLGAEGNIYRFTSGDYSTAGFSLRPVTRLYFYPGKQVNIFGETKGGIIFMVPQNPDKLINFTFTATLGADWYFKERMAVRLSGGYTHFSNGKPSAELRNPTWDGIGMSVALVRRLR